MSKASIASEGAGGDEIVEFHAVREPRPDPLAVVLHERQVELDEPVAEILVRLVGLEPLPEILDLFGRRLDRVVCHVILLDRLSIAPAKAAAPPPTSASWAAPSGTATASRRTGLADQLLGIGGRTAFT
jgi:hypothetical protein